MDINDLNDPEVLAALGGLRRPNKPSQRGRKVTLDGITFDSVLESQRYQYLRALEAAGEIWALTCHPQYEILPAFKTVAGKHKSRRFTPDFEYWTGEGQRVVEDVKGRLFKKVTSKKTGRQGRRSLLTPGYILRRELFQRQHPDVLFKTVGAERSVSSWDDVVWVVVET